MDVWFVCISMQDYRCVWGHASPRKFLEIRCSEIVSEAILGQKQSRSSYMACGTFHPIFGFAKPADFEFPREKVLSLAEQQVG